MALKVTLKPGEKFVINGAVVVNGDRRTHLLIQNNVSILREKDVMLREDANSPVRRIYFAIQMLYLGGEDESYRSDFENRIREFMEAISDTEALAKCEAIIEDVGNRQFYKALLTCKRLFSFEEVRLNYIPDVSDEDEMEFEEVRHKV